MKWLIKILMIVLILFMSNLFLFKTMDGDASLEVKNPIPDFIAKMFDFKKWGRDISKASGKAMGNERAGQTKIYRWKAADGTLQFSNLPPNDVTYETVWVDPDANIIESVKPPASTATSATAASQVNMPSLLTVSPDKVKKLVQDAKNVQKLADDRSKTLEKL